MRPDVKPANDLTPQGKILVVDDDVKLATFLSGELECEGYEVRCVEDGQSALIQLRTEDVDLVLLDWNLPDFTGIEVCRRLRRSGNYTHIMMISGKDAVKDRMEALDAGADDYVVKPFSIDELMARVRAQLRRLSYSLKANSDKAEQLAFADLTVDMNTREVTRGALDINLSVREFDLLVCLLRDAGRVLKRDDIVRSVWGENHYGDDNLLDVYIRYLRRKLEPNGLPTLIQTVRGVGFILKEGIPKGALVG